MYCIFNKEQVIDGLQKAAAIIPARTGVASLRSLWLKAEDGSLSIMSTDANIEFTGMYAVSVRQEGFAGVNGRSFVELLRKLPPGDITLRTDERTGNLSLEQGRRSYMLPASETTWFTPLNVCPDSGSVVWTGDFFQEIIEKVFFCISDDDNADAIACLFLKPCGNGRIDVCGLNGHQFALASFVNDALHALLPEQGMLVQKKYVNELRKWLGTDEIEVNLTEKRLFVRSADGRETLSLPLSGYAYPDYSSFMARLFGEGIDPARLEFDRCECQEALDRLSIFNTHVNDFTSFALHPEELELSAQGQEVGSARESMEVSYGGLLEKIVFPTRRMMEILAHFHSSRLRLLMAGGSGPCGIMGDEDPDYTVLIMPVELVEEQEYEPDDE
jgi:DNA polymerase-3 subunit beta